MPGRRRLVSTIASGDASVNWATDWVYLANIPIVRDSPTQRLPPHIERTPPTVG